MRLSLCVLVLVAVAAAPTAAASPEPCDIYSISLNPPDVTIEPDCIPPPPGSIEEAIRFVEDLIQS